MSTTISAQTQAVVRLLGNRSDAAALVPEAMGDAVVELSNSYPFQELMVTGPLVQFIQGQGAYPSSFFEAPPAGGINYTFNKMISWFFYLQPPASFSGGGLSGSSNPGYGLKFRDVEDLEVLINTLTLPTFWSQHGSQGAAVAGLTNATFYVAGVPNIPYYTYARYQWLHPFTQPAAISSDPIYLPSTWYDIIQYATAERVALDLRMQDVADRMHMKLFGDPKKPREVGLIKARTSQTEKNQSRTTRSIRLQRYKY